MTFLKHTITHDVHSPTTSFCFVLPTFSLVHTGEGKVHHKVHPSAPQSLIIKATHIIKPKISLGDFWKKRNRRKHCWMRSNTAALKTSLDVQSRDWIPWRQSDPQHPTWSRGDEVSTFTKCIKSPYMQTIFFPIMVYPYMFVCFFSSWELTDRGTNNVRQGMEAEV